MTHFQENVEINAAHAKVDADAVTKYARRRDDYMEYNNDMEATKQRVAEVCKINNSFIGKSR
jgi:hypothetical protein